jgi:AAA domain, putative AbiEii toxin, Type IV TA system
VGNKAIVTRYGVVLDGEPFGAIHYNSVTQTVEIVDHNSEHPALAFQDPQEFENLELAQDPEEDEARWEQDEDEGPSEWQSILAHVRGYAIGSDPQSALAIRAQQDALPVWGMGLDLALKLPTAEEIRFNPGREKDWADNIRLQADWVIAVFSLVFVGTGQLVRDFLAGLRYLGPNRQVPPRGFSPNRTDDPERWASGLAGWDLLFRSPGLVDRVNQRLREPTRLGVGYEMELAEYREFEERGPILAALRANRLEDLDKIPAWLTQSRTNRRLQFRPLENPAVALEPADLGVGVSQLVPVVAAALDDTLTGSLVSAVRPVLVEHPELNLHPRLQAELADVFLEGALAEEFGGRIFLIETHSEHLTLRFLRRIRENTRGQSLFGMTVKPTAIGVWYVDRANGPVTVKQILVDVEGEFVQPWPEDDSLFEQDFREKYS